MALAFLPIILLNAAAHGQSPDPALQAVAAFERTTQAYALMHRRLESQIGAIEFGTPVAEINRIINQLAFAIRAERHDARQGDVFAPALGDVLRARITDALREHHYTAHDVRAAGRAEGVDYGRVRLKVHDTFPWILAAAMFPCIIEALPPLPPELQYRIVGDDLLLVDVHASLVVDVLPQALLDFTERPLRLEGGAR